MGVNLGAAKGDDGVELGGLAGGDDAKEEADAAGDADGEDDGAGGDACFKGAEGGDEEDSACADGSPDEATDGGENDRFDEELAEDVALGCADGFAQTDFLGALSHGNEHDVHDADAANKEGDRCDRS